MGLMIHQNYPYPRFRTTVLTHKHLLPHELYKMRTEDLTPTMVNCEGCAIIIVSALSAYNYA